MNEIIYIYNNVQNVMGSGVCVWIPGGLIHCPPKESDHHVNGENGG